jgi:formate hydrogenlyase subunit 6/NADH:ubiquinone oxidoreductase subunit I
MSVMNFAKTALKNLNSRPATLMYPKKKRVFYARTRGHIAIGIESCIFCGICAKKCPSGAIRVDKTGKVWEIDRLKCVQCNACVESCPKKCLAMEQSYTEPSMEKTKDVFTGA